MPFVKEKYFVKEKTKAFLCLIRDFGYTQKEAQRLIAKGRIYTNGVVMDRPSGSLEGEYEFIYFKPISRGLEPTYTHKQFVVFDKPSGVLIHPQNRNTEYSLIDEVKDQFGRDANIAHRIDQETSGLVLCARNKESERDLKMMFQERDMDKKYLALVHGHVSRETFIDVPLLRKEDESAIVRMVVKVDKRGKASQTNIVPLEYFDDLDMTLVEAQPRTGRQHQIRVHLFHVKHPIVGDPIYGQTEENIVRFLDKEISPEERIKLSGASRLLLHANELAFELKGEKYHIRSKINFIEVALSKL